MEFQNTLKRISPTLRRITYKLKRQTHLFDQEDLFQEAVLHLWQDFCAGKLEDKTESYILQGCYFHLKNYIRKNYDKANLISLEKLINKEGEDFDLNNVLSLKDSESCFEVIHCKMLIEQINHNGLTQREKEVFHFALDGLTTREIGKKLGVSHVRIVKLKHKIREKCRKYMDLPL